MINDERYECVTPTSLTIGDESLNCDAIKDAILPDELNIVNDRRREFTLWGGGWQI
jgi:hypothetical protein